jgi:phenylalanyl-tRNA synthetase beta chain
LRNADDESSRGFLDCKGLVESLLELFRLTDAALWAKEAPEFLHPGRSASLKLNGQTVGHLGEIHPDVCDALGVSLFLLFELDFDSLLEYAPRQIKARSLPRFPSVERDFAVVVDREFPSQQIVTWINNLGEALIEQVQVFDQYLGSSIPEGKKSLAYKISYRADDRTLTDSEINMLHQKLVEQIGKLFGAQLRT